MKKYFLITIAAAFLAVNLQPVNAAAPQNDLLEFASPLGSRLTYSQSTDIAEATSNEGSPITKSVWYSMSGLTAAPARWRVDNGQLLICTSGVTSVWLAGNWNKSGDRTFPCKLVAPGATVTTEIAEPLIAVIDKCATRGDYDGCRMSSNSVTGWSGAGTVNWNMVVGPGRTEPITAISANQKITLAWTTPGYGCPITRTAISLTGPSGTKNYEVTGATNRYAIPDRLANGTTYSASLRAFCGDYEAPASPALSVVPGGPGDAPEGIALSASPGAMTFTWTGVTADSQAATQVESVLTCLDGTGPTITANVADRKIVFTSIPPRTTCTAKALTKNSLGRSDWSILTAPTRTASLPGPSNLRSSLEGKSLQLTWQSAAQEEGISLSEYQINARCGGKTRQYSTKKNTYTISDLPLGESCAISVAADFGFAKSEAVNLSETPIVRDVPEVVSGLRAEFKAGKVQVFFDSISSAKGREATSFEIVQLESSRESNKKIVSAAEGEAGVAYDNLQGGKSYTFAIYGINEAGKSPRSSAVSVYVPAKPSVPTKMRIRRSGENALLEILDSPAPTWLQEREAKVLITGKSEDAEQIKLEFPASASILLPEVLFTPSLTLQIQIINEAGISNLSSAVTAGTNSVPSPTEVNVRAGDGKADFTWKKPNSSQLRSIYVEIYKGEVLEGYVSLPAANGSGSMRLQNGETFTFILYGQNGDALSVKGVKTEQVVPGPLPKIVSQSTTTITPKKSLLLKYEISEPVEVFAQVLSGANQTVYGPISLGNDIDGEFSWNGASDADGESLADGNYLVQLYVGSRPNSLVSTKIAIAAKSVSPTTLMLSKNAFLLVKTGLKESVVLQSQFPSTVTLKVQVKDENGNVVVSEKRYKSSNKLSSQVIWTGKQSSSKFSKKKILAGAYQVSVSWVDGDGNEGALDTPLLFQVKK
ncbi:MAG: hypothetical protein FJW46_07250 [Actinobacteria bacterium]|nr:hypothetical protein [Actinomycetota bacterium]